MTAAAASLAPFGAISFAYYASIGVFNTYAPLWFQSLGLTTLAIGGIASLQAWTRVVVPYGWSWFGDHWGRGGQRAALLRIATAFALVFAALLPWVSAPAAVTAVVVLLFMANGAVTPLSEAALVQRMAADGGLDVGRYGRVRLWGSIGFILAVTLFGALLDRVGIGCLPAVTTALFALLLAAACTLPATAPSATAAAGADAAPGVWAVLRRPVVGWFFAGTFFAVLAHVALYVFFSLYLDALGYGKASVGALWALSVAAEIVFFWSQGRWFARWDAHTWLVVAAAATVLRFGGVALGGAWWPLLVLLQLTHALTFAAQHAACIALVDRHFSGPLRGRGMALYTTLGYGVSGVVGGVAGGAVVARGGYAAVFAGASAMGAVAVACYMRCRALDRASR